MKIITPYRQSGLEVDKACGDDWAVLRVAAPAPVKPGVAPVQNPVLVDPEVAAQAVVLPGVPVELVRVLPGAQPAAQAAAVRPLGLGLRAELQMI